MFSLLYHKDYKGVSEFDRALKNITRNQRIKIACPYISIDYLEDELLSNCLDFSIVTDIQQLLPSYLGNTFEEVFSFINNNKENIYDYRNLHAKVVISPKAAYLGSANLTYKGMQYRQEIGVIIDDKDKLFELNKWYDKIKTESLQVDDEQIKRIVKYKKELDYINPSNYNSPHIAENDFQVETKLLDYSKKIELLGDDENARFERLIKLYGHNIKFKKHIKLLKTILKSLDIPSNDPRLVLSMPYGKGLNFSVNKRYVATFEGKVDNLSLHFNIAEEFLSKLDRHINGAEKWPHPSDKTSGQINYYCNADESIYDEQKFLENLIFITKYELEHGKKSHVKKSHSALLYDFIVSS